MISTDIVVHELINIPGLTVHLSDTEDRIIPNRKDLDLCVIGYHVPINDLRDTVNTALSAIKSSGMLLVKDVYKKYNRQDVVNQLSGVQSISYDIINTRPYGILSIYHGDRNDINDPVDKMWQYVSWICNIFETKPTDSPVDLVYTIADTTDNNNENLRLSLRSVAYNNIKVGNIWVVTDNPPTWLEHANILKKKDTFDNCKDANIINKVLTACNCADVSDRFIFMSDDQIFNNNVPLNMLSPVYNPTGIDGFRNKANKNRWTARMINTLEFVYNCGGDPTINWDSHVPQPIDKGLFKYIMSHVPYDTLPGMCINTTYFGLKHEPHRITQNAVKSTFESIISGPIQLDKPYIGYNDNGYYSGLRDTLLSKFREPSIYENDGGII